jgi:FkbM family methyltransferase
VERRVGVVVAVAHGETFRVDEACRWFSLRGDEFWEELMREIRPGDRFADVGANVGAYTVGAARRGAVVTAYEPNPEVAVLLRRSVQLNRVSHRVRVQEVAVGAEQGEKRLHGQGLHGALSAITPSGEIAVDMVTLRGPFDVVKIDVEGYELEVLRGAKSLLAGPSRPRAIFIELHGTDPFGLGLLPGYSPELIGVRGGGTEHWVARLE